MEEFKSEEELYNRLKRALITRTNEFKRNKFFYVTKEDIWNFLKETKWKNSVGLELHEMVRDVLNADYDEVDYYIKDKLKDQKRDLILESK